MDVLVLRGVWEDSPCTVVSNTEFVDYFLFIWTWTMRRRSSAGQLGKKFADVRTLRFIVANR